MSAIYSRRNSAQSYSSNIENGDSFQLYGRRFGNTYEASQIYDLLKLRVALLPGGKDSKQGPIIIFPSDSGIHRVSERDVIDCLVYLGSIPSEASVKRCFSIIIDNQKKTLSTQINFILSCCQKSFDNTVSDIYIVEEPPIMNLDFNKNISSAKIHVVTKSQLQNSFNARHLLPNLGGTLNYSHEKWLMLRKFIESYMKEAKSVCSELDMFAVHMSSNLFQATPSNLQNLWMDYMDVKRRAEDFVRKGDEFCISFKSSTFETFEEDEMIVLRRASSAMTEVEGKLSTLDVMWRRKDVEEQQKAGITSLEKEMNEVVEWILGPGDKLLISETGIGRNYDSADELRKQHERLELKCLDSYGKYAELRHKVEAYAQYSTAEESKATELEAQRDYMDTVYRSFAKRLEQRRNTVIAAVKFHRLLDEISILLEEIRKRLNYKTDLDSVEELLDTLNGLSEKLDFNYSMAMREGGLLKDMLCLPLKDAYGHDVNINREPDITYVENCLEKLQNDRENIRDALELKKLELQQFLQLKICEQNIEQAIEWIKELDGLINDPDSQNNQTLKDLERFQEELGKGENTAKNSFDYGQELLKAALYLRRALGLDMEPNSDQANRLNEAWRNFSRGSNENAARRTAVAIFDKKSDEFLKATENLLANLDVSAPQSYEEEKRNLDQHHRELQMTANGLNERIQRPILFEQNDRNQPNMDNLQVAENIKIKIQRMNDRMDQLNRKWSSFSKNGYVAGQRGTYEGSDSSGNSQLRRIEPHSMGMRREVYDGNRELNGHPAPQNQLNDWLESHALRRITSTNNMGSTLESVEDFYEKHVESLQDMKAHEHVLKSGINKNLPQQWNVVQEIIKQRITLALSLIKFHLSFNKASEDLERVERWIDGKSDVNIDGALTELEENEDTMARNAEEFLNSASNQVHNDEYLNVDQPKYFVRDIMDQWKQRKGQVERGLLARSMEDLLHEANLINEELNNLENDFLRSPSAPPRNIAEFNNRMEDLSKRISSLEDYYNLEQKSPFISPGHSSEVQSKLEDLRLKCSNLKRLFQQNSHVDTFKKDVPALENIPQNEFYVVRPLQNAVAKKGESLKLSCYINASPAQKIRVKWLKDGDVLNCSDVKYDSRYKDGQCDLTISDVSQEDSGRYSCIATDGQVAISTADVLVEAAPSIKEPLRDKIIKEGEPVEFSIKVTGNPTPTVQWFLNGKELSNSPDFKIFSQDDVHTLRISEVFDEDKGLYTVLAKNKYGETTDRARLKVSVSPSADDSTSKHVRSSNWNPSPASSLNASAQPSLKTATSFESRPNPGFLKPLVDKTSEAGEDIILECNLPLFPAPSKVTWYKDGIEITRTMPGIRTSMQQGSCRLVIERADTSHSGKYVCKAQLKENLYETSMLLTVRDKLPVMLPESKYSPSATINTKKTDASSKFDTSFQVAPFESSLRSQDFQVKKADGDLGFSVRNSAAPQFVKKMESSLLVENSSTTFNCKVTGEPAPNIQWYHNGRLIRPSSKYRMKLSKDGECSLMVTDCNKQDAGFYTCCALNVTGRDVCSAELMSEGANDIDTTSYVEPDALKRMLRPKSSTKTEEVYAGVVESLSEPSFSKSCVTQVTVDEGETARIECKVYGHPSPDLSWYKNGKEVRRGGRFQVVTNQEGMQSLVIKLVQCSDAGVYTCRAHNKSGQATMDFTLQVEDISSKYQSKIYLSRNAPSVRQAEVVSPPQSPPGYTHLSKVFSDSTKLKMSSKQAEVQRSVENELSLQSLPAIRNNSSPKPLDHFPPRYLVTPDPVTANEGGYAKFWAKVSANPPATVTWFINGLEIFTSSRFNVYFDGLMHVLEIMKVKNFDDGEVKVTARNYKGDVQHAVQLSVADATNLRTHLHPSTDALQSKKRSLPSIEISSTKDESFIPPIKTEGRSISIKTKSVTPSCPLFLEKLCESVKAKDGEEVVLTCAVVGNPTPEVSWLKNGKPVSIYEDYTTAYDQHLGVARLVINDCLPGDCGRFECIAKNVFGQSRTECLLSLENSFTKAKSEDPSKNRSGRVMSFKVLKELLRSDASSPQSDRDKNQYAAPSFTKQLSDGEVNDGDQVILSACFEGNPFPSISWFFNDKPIQPNSDFLVTVDAYKKETSLKIVEIFPEDNGIYSCKATNVLGVAATGCNLTVKYDKTTTTAGVVSGVEIKEERKFSETISLSGSSTPVQFSTPPTTKNSEIHFRNSPVFKGMTIEMEIPEVISQKEIQLRRKGEAIGIVRQELQVNVETKEMEKTEGKDLILNPLKTPDPVRKKRRTQAIQSKSLVIEKSIPVFVEPLEQIVNQSSGKLLELKCQIFSATPATIEWYHKNELLTDALTVRSSFDPKSGLVVLCFPSIQQRHGGLYRCVAKNFHGSASCETELFIKDEITVQPPPLHGDFNDQMIHKTPEVTDHKLPSVTTIAKVCFASIEELKQLEDEKQVNVEDTIRPQDKTAVATTSIVEKESAYLLETFKQHKVLPCTETVQLSKCKEQTLLCRISPVSPKMSTYLKTLRHAAIKNLLDIVDHSEVCALPLNPALLEELTLEIHFPVDSALHDPRVVKEASVVTSHAFEKDETSSDDDIFYDCVEFDEKGKHAEHLVTSSVKDKKTFLSITGHPPQTLKVFEGQSFVLECNFEGLPLPKVIWFKNDLEIKNNERTTIENYDSRSILTVDSAPAQDDSIYSCRVQNQFHSAETSTHVLVECGSHSGFVKKGVPSYSAKEIEQETVKFLLKDDKKTHSENGELKGKESHVSSHIDLKDQKSESPSDSARFKKDLKSPDPPLSLRDSLNQEIIWRGKEKLKPDIPREVGVKEFKELEKSEPFQSFDSKLKTSDIKNYAKFGTTDKSVKVSVEGDYDSIENQATKDGTTDKLDGMGQSADGKQEALSKKVRNEVKDFTTSTHKDVMQDSQTERSRTTAKDDIRNKSPEEFSIGKKIKSSETDGSRSQNESFFQTSKKSTTETTEYKWKHFLEGSDEDSEPHIGESDKGSPCLESSETFYRKEESDHRSIEESRQKLNLKSDVNQMSKDLIPKDTAYSKTKDGYSKEDDKKDYKIESGLDSRDKSQLKDVAKDIHVDIKYKSTVSDDVDHMKPQIKEEPNENNLRGVDENAGNVVGPVVGISKYETTEEQKDAPQDGEDEPLSSTSEEERAREQKYISTLTEEITFKDVNNVPQKFSTRLLKTVEYTKTNSIKSSTKDVPDSVEEGSRSKSPYVRHAMSEFQWNIQDSEDQSNVHDIGDQYKKWREDASVEISDNNHQIYNQDSQPEPNQNEYSLNQYGEHYTSNSIRNERNPGNVKHLSSYIDKASGNHLEISNKGVQYDSNGKIATGEAMFREPIEKSITIQDIETTDEIMVETKVTQVKTVSMQLSETGDINLTETTQVQTDTDMKETKKTREREELVVSHLVSNVTEVVNQEDQSTSNVSLQEEQSTESVSEKYDLFSTWNVEPGVLIAIHSYEPDSDEVMSLHEGERLEFLEENSEDWWFVRKFFDSRQGFVPSRLLQTKEDFDKNVSDKIAQQIDRLEDSLSTKLEDYGQESPPHMVNLLEDVSVRDGEPATFKCLVSGNPKPSITWFHNSKIVKPSPDFLQFYDPDFVCSLSIREVFPEDGGRYTMIAKNLFGIASSSAELLVMENEYIREKEETKVSGSPILVVQPRHLVLDEGSTAMFTCKFKGKFPMKVTWYKDGRQVSPGDKTKFDVTEEDGEFITAELTLESVDESHMGKYRVLVSNELGETEALTSLIINALPKTIDFKANLKKSLREPDTNVTFKQERVLEEKSQQESMHSHTEANSSFGSSEVIQHDFRNVLKPSSSTNNRY